MAVGWGGISRLCRHVTFGVLVSGFSLPIGAYCYAELGTLIKKSGGDYAYIMEAFGDCGRPCTVTIVALTFAIYSLRPFYPNCPPPEWAPELLAVCLIVLMTAINCISIRAATFVQDFFTVAKVFALIMIIGAGGILLCLGKPQYYASLENLSEGTSQSIFFKFGVLLSLAHLVLSKDVYALINYIQISYWLAITAQWPRLFYFRKLMPDAPNPPK
ncbi:unnamed protein product, partial [Mesorhabditis belari]|uniref:Uncharacterized protein n=1 Tax=Mesorhabditis belari TaxID=2138241 RepID=A0AAF3FN95_9BILA